MDTQVLKRHLKGMPQVRSRKICARRIYRFGHVGWSRVKPIYIGLCNDLCKGSNVMAVKTTEVYGLVDHRIRVYGSDRGRKRTDLDEEFPQWTWTEARQNFLLHYDNQSAIHLAKNVAYHSRTKHIQRRYHWLREKVDDMGVCLCEDPYWRQWIRHAHKEPTDG